jgi:fibronectin-binding autotransporter adhesin
MHAHRTLAFFGKTLLAIAALELAVVDIRAATQVWDAGGTGTFGDSTKYNAGAGPAPVAGDTVTSDGTGSVINFGVGDTITLTGLDLNFTSGATVMNHGGGDLTVGVFRFGGAGSSRNPTYNFSSGTLNVTTAWSFGNGSNTNFNLSGGTVNLTPSGNFAMGNANDAKNFLNISSGTFNVTTTGTGAVRIGNGGNNTSEGTIQMTGGVFNASTGLMRVGASGSGNTGNFNMSGNSVFNLTATGNMYLANNGANGNLNLSDSAQVNGTGYFLVVGQFGTGTGTLTMSGNSMLTFDRLVVGGENDPAAVNGIINLNGGTIVAGEIRRGSSNLATTSTSMVFRGNGGTVRASTHAGNANYFNGLFVDLQAGGLNFDTNGNDVTITNSMSGVGGLTKTGAGTLTLSGVSTYTGITGVQAGTMRLGVSNAINVASNVRLSGGRLGFSTGNFSQGTTVAVGLGTLDLDATSILDFGDGDQLLHFANSSGEAWTGTLDVYNWDGTLDNLYFGTDNTGLTVGQLAQINFYSGDGTGFLGLGAWAGADGEVMVVIPEPSTYALLFAGLFVVIIARRKRLSVSV